MTTIVLTKAGLKNENANLGAAMFASALISVLFVYARVDKMLSFGSATVALCFFAYLLADTLLPEELLKRPSSARYHAFEITALLLYPNAAGFVFVLLVFLVRALLFQRAVESQLAPGSRSFFIHSLGLQSPKVALAGQHLLQIACVVASAFFVLMLRKFKSDTTLILSVIPFSLAVLFAGQMLPLHSHAKGSGDPE